MTRTIEPSVAGIRWFLTYSKATRWTGVRISLAQIAANFGASPNRSGRYSKRAYAIYKQVKQLLQRMKRDDTVVYVRGNGAGWRLT